MFNQWHKSRTGDRSETGREKQRINRVTENDWPNFLDCIDGICTSSLFWRARYLAPAIALNTKELTYATPCVLKVSRT